MIHRNDKFSKLLLSKFATLVIASIFVFVSQHALAANNNWQESLAKGNNYLNREAISEAEKYFSQAVKQIALVPHTVEEKIRCLNALANAYALENKTDAAKNTYEQSLKLVQNTYGTNTAKELPCLFALGSIYESAGDHDVAMHYYKKAIAINEKHYGPFCPTFANLLPTSDLIGIDVSQTGKNDKYQKEKISQLTRQPGLDASKIMEARLPTYKEDLLKGEDRSDQDLISVFNNEIAKVLISDDTSANIAVSPNNIKQADKARRSRRI